MTTTEQPAPANRARDFTYNRWMESIGIPIHRGYFIEDLRKVPLGRWDERDCDQAFVQLVGMEGICEARVSEIPPGKTLPPMKLAIDEVVYVLEGRGLTTVWRKEGEAKRTFEWQTRSMFMLPHHHWHQLSNAQGQRPVRLLHTNYLPIAMSALQEPSFFFTSDFVPPNVLSQDDFYAQAKAIKREFQGRVGSSTLWYGNFFPDLKAWDQLVPFWGRGAGGHVVSVQFPNSEWSAHMSVFPAQTYKKGHRHGPGRVIVIPDGEGVLHHVAGGQGEGDRPLARGEHVRAAESLVPPALQPRRQAGPLPGPAPAAPVLRPRRARGGPGAGPDRVPLRGALDPAAVRG